MKRHDIRNKEVAGVMATIRGFLTRGRLGAIARRSNVDVDDVVQAVVTYHLSTKHGLAVLQGEDGRKHCYVTARSRLIDATRRAARCPVVEVRDDALGCTPPGALAFLVGMEEGAQQQRIARKVPRTAITTARLSGSTYAEAAKVAGVHTSTAWRQFQKAMKQAQFLASQLSLFPEERAQNGDGRGVETMGGFQP